MHMYSMGRGGGGGNSMSSFYSLKQLETSLRAGSLHLLAADGRQRARGMGLGKVTSLARPKIFPEHLTIEPARRETENGI